MISHQSPVIRRKEDCMTTDGRPATNTAGKPPTAEKEVISHQSPVISGKTRNPRPITKTRKGESTKKRKGAYQTLFFRVFPLSCFRGCCWPSLYVSCSRSCTKKHIDKVSFAGIFNKLLDLLSPFETLVRPDWPEMPCGTGLRKGGDSHNRGYWQS